jgi:drug/metabolite transporter (DMT)-like permease
MDILFYWLGVFLAIASGVSNNYGTVLQKKVVNKYKDDSKFFRNLVKNPLWLFGLVLQLGIGAILFLIAQLFIGPTLIPGLMGAGLIVLAIGAVRIVGEHLKASEVLGIILMIVAIAFIGFSNMNIDLSQQDFLSIELFYRTLLFTGLIYFLAFIVYILYKKDISKGISLSVYSGFQFALSNFWIGPLMGVLISVFGGKASLLEIILFILALIILTSTNIVGTSSIQKAFREGQASNLIPIQQVPIQIAPVFYYIAVFLLPIPNILSLVFLIIGIISVIISSFLLGRRQAQIETVK